jgi:hypothetical protein
MKLARTLLNLSLTLSLLALPITVNADTVKPKIQIAILLDSSNSMDGLIDQTRSQLWQIINSLNHVKKNGQVPILEVALYHYGNDALPSSEGFNRLLQEFTTELDLISEKLFTIKTYGGQEYAGWVIQSAINQLKWDQESDDFRAIFIAGNEPFDQGTVSWQESVNSAAKQDILVNTIYCGEAESTERTLWSQGATLGKGSSFNINQNENIAWVESPYDQEIIDLNNKLNQTYIPYGEEGIIGQQRQATEDANAQEQIVTRGESKASNYYRNASWDLVDALGENAVDLEELDESMLPEVMRGMTLEQKREYVASIQAERSKIQARIQQLSQQRTEYLESQKLIQANIDTLDNVMIQALRRQLAAKGFTLE